MASDLCEVCSSIDIRSIFKPHLDDRGNLKLRYHQRILGPVKSLLAKQNSCALCRLIVGTIGSTHDFTQGLDDKIHLIRGRLAYDGTATTFRLKTCQTGSTHCSFNPIQLLAEDATAIGLPRLFHGRVLTADCADVSLAKEWLRRCESEHGSLCSTTGAIPYPLHSETLFVDVQDYCLVSAPKDPRYVALSYCWPTTRMFAARKDNVEGLQNPYSLKTVMSELPPSIQDAIECTRELGERYLWVDALCIVQDSQRRTLHQISQMGNIYSSAAMTIVAAPCQDNDPDRAIGLPGFRRGTRTTKQIIETVQDLRLTPVLAELGVLLSRSRWLTRAWTMQEQRLSKRILYFTDEQMYFTCSCSTFCEDCMVEGASTGTTIEKGSNIWNPARDDNESSRKYSACTSREPYKSVLEAVLAYMKFASEYAVRSLSVQSDILRAVDGILKVLGESMNTSFCFGMPSSYLALTLPLCSFRGQQRSLFLDDRAGRRPTRIPSWTWAAWSQTVFFRVLWHTITVESSWFLIDDEGNAIAVPQFQPGKDFEKPSLAVHEFQPSCDYPTWLKQGLEDAARRRLEAQDFAYAKYIACCTAISKFKVLNSEKMHLPFDGRHIPFQKIDVCRGDRLVGGCYLDRDLLLGPDVKEVELMYISRLWESDKAKTVPKKWENRMASVLLVERVDRGNEEGGCWTGEGVSGADGWESGEMLVRKIGAGHVYTDAFFEDATGPVFVRLA
ncbi:HET-domain-containing protein [Corynespora cassiicola Philippines]|uniref:HET-domain-containing protein n=1 Tax=Corynespora cassiicola Philippines TaxID=1448308 RepID=A0A2T2NJY1_CORCC|nr:HET-domain-containing protein [Corynespora cassiicola Philippines]